MNTLMLNTHQDHPGRTLPGDRQSQRQGLDEIADQRFNAPAVFADFFNGGPVIVAVVEIVPAHLIHTNRHHRFDTIVQTRVDKASGHQLINVEGGGVAKIED